MGRSQRLLSRSGTAGGADSGINSHLNEAQRERLPALESSDEDEANDEDMATKGRGKKAKQLRHLLCRTPTETLQARWVAVQQARDQGLSLRAIAQRLGMARDTVGKYAKAESPPTKQLSASDRTKALAASLTATDQTS